MCVEGEPRLEGAVDHGFDMEGGGRVGGKGGGTCGCQWGEMPHCPLPMPLPTPLPRYTARPYLPTIGAVLISALTRDTTTTTDSCPAEAA